VVADPLLWVPGGDPGIQAGGRCGGFGGGGPSLPLQALVPWMKRSMKRRNVPSAQHCGSSFVTGYSLGDSCEAIESTLQNAEGRQVRVYSKALVEENGKPSRRQDRVPRR